MNSLYDTGWRYWVRTVLRTVLNVASKLLLLVIFAFPFLWMVTTAFKTYRESIAVPPTLWINSPTFDNIIGVFQSGPYATYFRNSVLIVVITISLQFLIYVPTAYIFARYEFRGKNVLFALVLISFMVPSQVTFVPVYLLFSKLKMLNSLLPMIIPFIANPFGIFLLRQNFMQIDNNIIEAAQLDNAKEWRIMLKVMVPIAKPTIITTTLFSFINNWNSYFWPLVMTNSKEYRPLTVGIAMLKASEGTLNWPLVMAGNLILVIPILIAYFFTKGKIMDSLSYTGIK